MRIWGRLCFSVAQQRVNILVNNQSSTCLGHLIEPQNGNYIGDVPIPSHSRWNILKMRCKCVLINSGEKLLSHNKRTTTSPSSSYQEDDDLLLLVRCLPTDLMTDLAITETIFHLIIKYRILVFSCSTPSSTPLSFYCSF